MVRYGRNGKKEVASGSNAASVHRTGPERKEKNHMARKRKQATPPPRVRGTIELHGRTYRARWMVDGTYYTRSTGTADREQAEAKLAEFLEPFKLKDEKDTLSLLAAKVQGVSAEIQAYEDAKPALALADGFDAYRKSTERPDSGARTLSDYEGQYGRFVAWMAKHYPDAKEMRHVSREMASEYMAEIATSKSANTFNKYVTLFKRVWEVLTEAARLTVNPWANIRHKANDKTATRRELTVDELRRVCESATGELRTLLAVGVYTGLRLGDCALLEWGSVDLTRRMIAVIPRKTARHANGRPVVIPLHGTLFAILTETPPDARKGYVMPATADAYTREPSIVTNRIQKHFRACGITTSHKADGASKATVEVGFHSLRHTFVSLSANAGVPMAHVQAIVGHSNPAMTRHYFHVSENALQNAVCALPDVGGALALPDRADAPQAAPCALCAALDGMTLDQLKAARAEIDRRIAQAEGQT